MDNQTAVVDHQTIETRKKTKFICEDSHDYWYHTLFQSFSIDDEASLIKENRKTWKTETPTPYGPSPLFLPLCLSSTVIGQHASPG